MMIITYKLNWNMLGHSMYFYDEMAGHYQPFVTGHFGQMRKNELEKNKKNLVAPN